MRRTEGTVDQNRFWLLTLLLQSQLLLQTDRQLFRIHGVGPDGVQTGSFLRTTEVQEPNSGPALPNTPSGSRGREVGTRTAKRCGGEKKEPDPNRTCAGNLKKRKRLNQIPEPDPLREFWKAEVRFGPAGVKVWGIYWERLENPESQGSERNVLLPLILFKIKPVKKPFKTFY